MSGADGDEAEECTSVAKDVSSVSARSKMEVRVGFYLNEGFNGDDTRNGNINSFSGSLSMTPIPLQPSRLPASITVAAAAKGAFVPRDDLLRNKATIGWRGSAATSAFRPAEPRKVQKVVPLGMNNVSSTDKLINDARQVDSSFKQANLSSGGRRDFDINDGPAVDELSVESSMAFSQQSRSGLTSQPMISGIRMNSDNMAAGFSSWFPAANNYSAMGIPQVLTERCYQPFPVITSNGPQRMVGPTSGVSSCTPDMNRGSVLLSSPAVSFPPTAFQYPGFPFGTSSKIINSMKKYYLI